MGDVAPGHNSVGKPLAESLGWEFIDPEHLHCAQSGSPFTDAERAPLLEALSAALESSHREWRDAVISYPILAEREQKQLGKKYPFVRLVYLRAATKTERAFHVDQSPDLGNPPAPAERSAALEYDDSVLTIDSSQGVDQILTTVLSVLILKQRSPYIRP
ncbi:MAG: hypothetical protein WCC04_14185 [Terriglobales bacterium]